MGKKNIRVFSDGLALTALTFVSVAISIVVAIFIYDGIDNARTKLADISGLAGIMIVPLTGYFVTVKIQREIAHSADQNASTRAFLQSTKATLLAQCAQCNNALELMDAKLQEHCQPKQPLKGWIRRTQVSIIKIDAKTQRDFERLLANEGVYGKFIDAVDTMTKDIARVSQESRNELFMKKEAVEHAQETYVGEVIKHKAFKGESEIDIDTFRTFYDSLQAARLAFSVSLSDLEFSIARIS